LKEKVAVAFGAVFPPRLGDRAAIAHDAIGEDEAPARVEPKKEKEGKPRSSDDAVA
jgi:hypothetical protein